MEFRIFGFLLTILAVSQGFVAPYTSSDYAVKTRGVGQGDSSVTITIGEKPNYLYTINGHTYSDKKVSVSGNYLNDEVHGVGYADLYAVVDSGVNQYKIYENQNTLRIDIWNIWGDLFEFQALVPYPVIVPRDIRGWLFNATAVKVSGPSRSYFFSSQRNFAGAGQSFNIADAPAPPAAA